MSDLPDWVKWAVALNADLEWEPLLVKLLAVILEITGAEEGFLILEEEEGLWIEAWCLLQTRRRVTHHREALDRSTDLSRLVVREAARRGRAVHLEDPLNHLAFTRDPFFRKTAIKAVLCQPLPGKQGLEGLVYLQNGAAGGPFGAEQVAFLENVAPLLGAVLARARRHETLRRDHLRIRQALEDQTSKLADLQKTREMEALDARAQGMVVFASRVLHRIGNEINSLGLLFEIIQEQVEDSEIKHLFKANRLLKKHIEGIGEFLEKDPKGRMLPRYYLGLDEALRKERQAVIDDLEKMAEQMVRLKRVLNEESGKARKWAKWETLDLVRMIEDIFQLESDRLPFGGVELLREIPDSTTYIRAQRNHLAFILRYLIKKAIESMEPRPQPERKLVMKLEPGDEIHLSLGESETDPPQWSLKQWLLVGMKARDDAFFAGLQEASDALTEAGISIWVSESGVGFRMSLPALRTESDA